MDMNACLKSESMRHAAHRSKGHFQRSGRFPGLDSFSLVEVVITIAIVSFVLVSLLGLMAYSSQLVHQSDNYARLSNVTRQVLAGLDSKAYLVTSTNVTANATNYFTYDGLPTNSASAYHQCDAFHFDSDQSHAGSGEHPLAQARVHQYQLDQYFHPQL